jgi:hypothetical protein
MPQFYDYNAYLQSGRPNFMIMMVISSAETQLFSLDKALRRGYPYFEIFTIISAPFMANLALLGCVLVIFVSGFIANYAICHEFHASTIIKVT